MTYDQKLRKVIAHLDSDGADSEAEWAANILKAIGITRETPDGVESNHMSEPYTRGDMNAGLPEAVKPMVMIPTLKPKAKGW